MPRPQRNLDVAAMRELQLSDLISHGPLQRLKVFQTAVAASFALWNGYFTMVPERLTRG